MSHHFQETHGGWEELVSMWGASQRNWCIMPPCLVMPSEIPKPMAGMFLIKSTVTGNLLLIDIFSHCWQVRILFILIKTIAVCFKFWQTIVLLSNIKFIEFLHDLMIVWYRYFGFEMDFHVKPPCKWHYPIMVSFQGDFINSCTESCEILELGSQGATPRQVILSIMLMHTFKLYDSITYFWV